MKSIKDMVTRIFGNRVVSWRRGTDHRLVFDYVVINLTEEPTEREKSLIVGYLKDRYPEVFVIENHHTRESDFQLRVYIR